jgi:hypothetical protein
MPQFHQRVGVEGRTQRWNVDRLIDLAQALPRITVALSSLHEFDEVYWFDTTFPPTCRAVVEHAQRIQEVDLGSVRQPEIRLWPHRWVSASGYGDSAQ